MVLVCSDDEVVPDSEVSDGNISDAFTDTIPAHNEHPEYDPDVHDPQTPWNILSKCVGYCRFDQKQKCTAK